MFLSKIFILGEGSKNGPNSLHHFFQKQKLFLALNFYRLSTGIHHHFCCLPCVHSLGHLPPDCVKRWSWLFADASVMLFAAPVGCWSCQDRLISLTNTWDVCVLQTIRRLKLCFGWGCKQRAQNTVLESSAVGYSVLGYFLVESNMKNKVLKITSFETFIIATS